MEAFTYKGISDGKYVEGEIEALNQDEASFKLKEQKVIITNLIKTKKKKSETKEKGKKSSFSLFGGKKKTQNRRHTYFLKTICNHGQSWFTNIGSIGYVKRSIRKPRY